MSATGRFAMRKYQGHYVYRHQNVAEGQPGSNNGRARSRVVVDLPGIDEVGLRIHKDTSVFIYLILRVLTDLVRENRMTAAD